MATATATKKNPTPIVPDDDDARLDRLDAKREERKKLAAFEKDGLATSTHYLLAVGGTNGREYPVRRLYTAESAKDGRVSAAAKVWIGETLIEVRPGDRPLPLTNTQDGVETEWFREITAEEVESRGIVSDRMAVRFAAEKARVSNSEGVVSACAGILEAAERKVEDAEKALVDARARHANSVGVRDASVEGLARSKAELVRWIERSGKSEQALAAAAALLTRQPEPEAPQEQRLHVAPGSNSIPEDWRVRAERLAKESETKTTTPIVAEMGR